MSQAIIRNIIDIRIPSILVVLITFILFLSLFFFTSNISINGKYNKFAGFFVNLKKKSLFHFTIVWIKFIFLISTLVSMNIANVMHYSLLIISILISIILAREFRLKIMELLGGTLNVVCLWLSSVFIDYLNNFANDTYSYIFYWFIVLFVFACSLVLFEFEIMSISGEKPAYEIKV